MFVRQWCELCGATTEVVVREGSDGATPCAGCGAPTSVRLKEPRDGRDASRLEALRRVDSLSENLLQSLQRLKGTLTTDEERQVLQATDQARITRGEADLGQLLSLLTDLEKAASIVAHAILRV